MNSRQRKFLARLLSDFQQELSESDLSELPPMVAHLTQCIHEAFAQPGINATYVQEEAGIDERVIIKRFELTHGVSVREYIEICRMLVAVHLLRHEIDFSLSSVAMVTGYDRYRTFARAFKRSFGCPPSEYTDECDPLFDTPAIIQAVFDVPDAKVSDKVITWPTPQPNQEAEEHTG